MHSKQNDPLELVQVPEPKAGKFNRLPGKFALTIVAIVALIVTGVAAGLIPRFRQQVEVGAETVELSIPTVAVVSPKPGQAGTALALSAEIKPWVEAPIYARASGYLKRRLVDIGSHVEEGQLLAEIDTPELNQELERARAQLAQAEASLGLAKITAGRWTELLKTASVSEQEAAEKQADFKLKTALADSARAEVRRLEKLQSFSRVTAPFAGRITLRNVDSGDLIVAAGSKEIFHLVQTQKLRVFVQVPQAMARSIGSGQSAEVILPEAPGRTFPARVIRTAGVIAADSRTLLVELEVDNAGGEILAGSYAQVRFSEAKREATLTLPSNTLLFRAEGPQVGVVLPDGKIELRSVKLGRDFGQTTEVLAGVGSQDRVIVKPSDSLANGILVNVAATSQTENKQ
ncbi:MAG: efflux RND transporter periplasmic adaptor subunit [Desulforhabdus sp.]|jgi:RND family efflux transporter MFP subunit|nr:efflux RND transporter periplasmic adaptor subunit [Desulforhabdus sp.]